MITLANGQAELLQLINKLDVNTDMNESQTRFHLIDNILLKCLGWNKDFIEVEKYESRGFSDYELGKPRLAILEAKREGNVFQLPAGITRKLTIDLPSLLKMNIELKDALEQVQQYCSTRGVPIAIVSNGKQFIAFLASRQDGLSVFDGNALVFKDLDALYSNFNTAWQLLSAEGIKEKNLLRYLSSGESGIPNKLSSKLTVYPKIRYQSDIQITLKQLSELFLQDIIESSEVEETFFKECYCESGALSKYALLSKTMLDARYASLFSSKEPHPKTQPVKEKNKDNFSPELLGEALTKRPIVLLGDVGVGKTSFVKNLIYNSAHDEFKNAIYIYIDLGSSAALSASLKEFVLNEIQRQLVEKYNKDINDYNLIKGVYANSLKRFPNSIWGSSKDTDPELYERKKLEMLEEKTKELDQHLKLSLNFISNTTSKQVIISLDNADQRDFETQQSAFIISQELAKDWNAAVFVSVRPQTFFKSKRAGALTAYPHKVFTISPPRIDRVIEKRLQFALSMAEGRVPVATLQSVSVNSESLTIFLKALLHSLSQNRNLQEFLSNITGGNIRSAIEFVTNFIGSPNVDAEKIIRLMKNKGSYSIPLHEFTKSALLGDYSHYSSNTSIAMNVYDVSTSQVIEHFLIPIICAYLNHSGQHRDDDGFCSTDKIVEEMQNRGFTATQIENALRRTTNKKLIETSQRVTFEEDNNGELIGIMPSSFRITSIGLYHLLRWIGNFTYFDAMIFDTPIFDTEFREKASNSINSLSISDRLERAKLFKEYLSKCWDSFVDKPTYFSFAEVMRDSKKTFNSVQKAVKALESSK